MSAVLQNAQFANSLFQPGVAAFARHNQGRLALAQQNLARIQELEANARDAALRRELANLQATVQREGFEVAEAGAERRARASEAAADLRYRASEAETARRIAESDRQREQAEKKANRQAVQAAYTRYTAAGGTKPLKEFGELDNLDTAFEIERATPTAEQERAANTFSGIARVVSDSRSALTAMLALTADEDATAKAMAFDGIATMPTHKKASERYADLIEDGASSDAAEAQVRKEYPAFGRALDALLNQQRLSIQAEKAKTPEFEAAQKQFGALLTGAREFALKNNLPGESLSALAPKAPETPKGKGSGIQGMREALGEKPAGEKPAAAARASTEQPGYPGIIDPLARAFSWANRPGSLEDVGLNFNLALSKAYEPALGSLQFIAGGQSWLNRGRSNREQARRAIEAELEQRGGLLPLLRR